MKINTHIVLVGLLLGFVFSLFSQWSDSNFNDLNNYKGYRPNVIGEINAEFIEDLEFLVEESTNFRESVDGFVNQNQSKQNVDKSYRALRDAFKSVEYIIEYSDKEAYDKIVNGAPLPKLEQKVSDLTVLEPHGLQVIDEMIAGSDFSNKDEKEAFLKEVELFEKNIKKINTYLKIRKFNDRQFFEATRQSIIRLASLGITGFDTPGTLQGIEDADKVLQTIKKYTGLYKPELNNVNQIELLKKNSNIISKGLKIIKGADFENFNRLVFIKEVINPLYKNIKDIHLALNYETIDEVSRYPQAVNYTSENLFEKDFLNNFYYVSLSKDDTYDEKSELGRLLFYDPILSQKNTMSCATCHDPKKAFTDGKTLSSSSNGGHLERNAMTLNYSVYATKYFHDLRAQRLEDQFEHVVLSEKEFNSSYKEILEKIKNSPTYVDLFKKAFPNSNQIKFNDIDYALAAYVMQLNTFDSPVDQYFQNKIDQLPKAVERGFNLFTGKAACATCHFAPLFSGNLPPLYIDSEAEVLGVPNNKQEPWAFDDDKGRYSNGLTQEVASFYEGAFKTSTVRNIALTAPYMHNGVFDTLEEVMDFYNKGGGAGNGLNLEHQTLSSDPLNLTEQEISDIIKFMEALSDTKSFDQPNDLPRDFPDENLNKRAL
ncbi:cytochrome c peroxidase [Winogradskyella sp. SYSU M77433]|uniref:cytochrome-c peroxidase n=1 Tax=Winogradskyella sp. SYSU M77433 TaxID=3042722 RepID=UPI0024803D9B|nr:cytochrome c peroxidase [Winogradskyella sp. SYSU M77433]MDH7912667.1 cytochrome c peroxidase [Winogradskyella sp. SYSU M77433]